MQFFKKNKIAHRALLILAVYVLHLGLFHHFYAHIHDASDLTSQYFAAGHGSEHSGGSISALKLMEKHESSSTTIDLPVDESYHLSLIAATHLLIIGDQPQPSPTVLRSTISDKAFRLYSRDGVFRI